MNKKYRIGYTQGTYDLFHAGHLNLLENAKKQCDYLIVGINSDTLVESYKNKKATIPEIDRARIVEALRIVDEVHIVNTLDKMDAFNNYNFDVIFIGDDWKSSERWINTEKELNNHGVAVVFLPHTDGISTTWIYKKLTSILSKK